MNVLVRIHIGVIWRIQWRRHSCVNSCLSDIHILKIYFSEFMSRVHFNELKLFNIFESKLSSVSRCRKGDFELNLNWKVHFVFISECYGNFVLIGICYADNFHSAKRHSGNDGSKNGSVLMLGMCVTPDVGKFDSFRSIQGWFHFDDLCSCWFKILWTTLLV